MTRVADFRNSHMMEHSFLLSDYLIPDFVVSMRPNSPDLHEFFSKFERTVFLAIFNYTHGEFWTDFLQFGQFCCRSFIDIYPFGILSGYRGNECEHDQQGSQYCDKSFKAHYTNLPYMVYLSTTENLPGSES